RRLTLCPFVSRTWAVIRLQPRTLHQPGKLQKLSKNDCVFTLPSFLVNCFACELMLFIFNEVQLVHKEVPGNCAARARGCSGQPLFYAPTKGLLIFGAQISCG